MLVETFHLREKVERLVSYLPLSHVAANILDIFVLVSFVKSILSKPILLIIYSLGTTNFRAPKMLKICCFFSTHKGPQLFWLCKYLKFSFRINYFAHTGPEPCKLAFDPTVLKTSLILQSLYTLQYALNLTIKSS